jgi:phosphoglycerate dehydrogenase-like enzyme
MPQHNIVFLDDDHVIRLARYALSKPAQITDDWVTAFFAPEPVKLQDVYDAAHGLHPSDVVQVHDMSASPEDISKADPTIIIFRRGNVDARKIASAPNLRLIQRMGERSEGIDLELAHQKGIHVSCIPRLTLIYTAEHGIMLMLALAKQLVQTHNQIHAGKWNKDLVTPADAVAYNWTGTTPLSGLYGKTLGIIGMGEVGSIMASIARGFGMRVKYHNRNRLSESKEKEFDVSYAQRDELLAQSDFVSITAANLPANRGMIDLNIFKLMKPSAFLINTSRGKLVNEDDLHTAVSTGLIAGAGLDVHWEEPRVLGDKLLSLPNIIMTPHFAGGSRFGVLEELKVIFHNCRQIIAGQLPDHKV